MPGICIFQISDTALYWKSNLIGDNYSFVRSINTFANSRKHANWFAVRPNAVYTVNVSVVQINKNSNKIAQKIVKFSQIISLTDRSNRHQNIR